MASPIQPLNPDVVESQLENVNDDVDEIAESVAVLSIVTEERHAEILEEINQCRNQLENLSTICQAQSTAENPLLAQMMAEIQRLAAQLESLKSSMDSMQSSPRLSPSIEPEPAPAVEVPAVIVEESAAVQESPRAKKAPKFRLL